MSEIIKTTLNKNFVDNKMEIENQASSSNSSSNVLKFVGDFANRDFITQDNKVCVFDFIQVVGGQKNYRDVWMNILKSSTILNLGKKITNS